MRKSIEIPVDVPRIREALKAANVPKPPPTALKELRAVLAAYPDVWQIAGDLGRLAREEMVDSMHPTAAVAESVQAGMEQIRNALRSDGESMVESLVIDVVMTCWLDMEMTRLRFAQLEGTTIEQADYWQRRLTLTQKRYLQAIETLARIRRMGTINLQVNLGNQQVNVQT